ncbi:MAG: beta-galactosidase, partial [Oscillospiraceae bacterium]|nr:beta-galactosidase [Oscillospiraceae bacterium]
MKINFMDSVAREAAITARGEDYCEVMLGGAGGGVTLAQARGTDKRYIVGYIEVLEEHSVALMVRFFLPGAAKENISIRFGLLPRLKTLVCFDLDWLDNGSIFTNRTPGTLKLVIHGRRTEIADVERVELGVEETFHDVRVRFEGFYLTDEKPAEFPLPNKKMVDEFGQWKERDWPGKIHSFGEMATAMKANEGPAAYPFGEWNKWGGDGGRKLKDGTGFFSTFKSADGRWHLVDPDGYDYFSLGPCGTRPGDGCRVDNFEKLCDWLPDTDDPEYKDLYNIGVRRRTAYMQPDSFKMISFLSMNLKKVYGAQWREKWEEISLHILKKYGINSQGNFPGLRVNCEGSELPYVREIPGFPATDTLIFRDFPDVLSPEFHDKSHEYAKQLEEWKDDKWLIGYFLRNEPEYNFVPGLAIANEVLHNPAPTYCRVGLIGFLHGRYGEIEKLNAAWGAGFKSFHDFEEPIDDCIAKYPRSEADLREYSVFLIREYVRVPAMACRAVDPNHLNLGLRWSQADNADMMAGWEYFDVFSVNCYYFDPTGAMEFIRGAGVDLPIMIGEYHCGALDRGLPATGLKGVENQEERGVMWRYFVEKTAAHPYGVGAHWFQYNDQFCLGRFDGENYQIGMVDICLQPHKE